MRSMNEAEVESMFGKVRCMLRKESSRGKKER